MLILKLFDSYSPLDCQTITLNKGESQQEEYLIGNQETCHIYLSNLQKKSIPAQIKRIENQYQFIVLISSDAIQMNDQVIEENQPHLLVMNDLIRIERTILIVAQVPQSGNRKAVAPKRTPHVSQPTKTQSRLSRPQGASEKNRNA